MIDRIAATAAPVSRSQTRHIVSSLALVLLLCLPAPAQAAGDDMNLSLCQQILSRILCKKPTDFGYAGKLDEGVYILSGFYASKASEFLCAVTNDGQVILQDRTWRAMRRVVPYTMDAEGKCMRANYVSPECPAKRGEIKVCPPKGAGDAKEQIKETFWNRPIPKILEEEYKAMGGREQQNGTVQPPAEGAPK